MRLDNDLKSFIKLYCLSEFCYIYQHHIIICSHNSCYITVEIFSSFLLIFSRIKETRISVENCYLQLKL